MKRKNFAVIGVTILLCSMILGALPGAGIAANSENVSPAQVAQGQEMQMASADLYGDANGDGKIDMRDVTYVGLITLGKKPTNELADANQDGRVNVLDITYIELIILGKAPSGTLRIGISKVYGRVGFFPPGAGRQWGVAIRGLVTEPLVQHGSDLEILPSLAKEWEIKDECKTWIFHLNEKAKWHDGKPVTSEDVKFTNEFIREMDIRYEEFMQEYLDEIETPDEHTVIFHMKKPFSPFLTWYTLGGQEIIPKHIWKDISTEEAGESEDMTGFGPFIFEKLDKDRNVIVFKVNNAYFLERPKVARVEIQMFRTEDSMLLALKKGDIDMVSKIKGTSVPSLLREEDIEIVLTPSFSMKNIWFNLRNYPLNITEVRQAMAYCIGYDQLAQISVLNYGEAGGYGPDMSSSMWWFNPDTIRYTRDVSKANELLDSIGFYDTNGDGVRETTNGTEMIIDLYVPAPDATYVREAELMRGWMDDAGIEIDIKAVDFPTWVDQFLFTHTFDTLLTSVSLLDSPYKSAYVDLIYCDMPGYRNETFYELVDALLSATTREEQKEVSFEIQEVLTRDVPGVSLYSGDIIDAYRSDRFSGFVPVPGCGIHNPLSILNVRKVAS